MNKNTKIIVGIVVVALVIFAGAKILENKEKVTTNEPIKIGAVFALSGSAAYWGQD